MSSLRERTVDIPAPTPHGPTDPPTVRISPNLFGVSFGVAGLAEAWSAAADLADTPAFVADLLWAVVAVIWAATAVRYAAYVIRDRRAVAELVDPVTAPFIALALIVPMLLGTALADHNRPAGVTVWAVAVSLTIVFGGWISGQWIISDLRLAQWHPGYFLPTVAGGLLAAATSAQLHYAGFAKVMFGYGAICWIVLGSILLQRLFTGPMLAVPLRPTIAIEVAPPVVAGIAWFGIDGQRIDLLSYGLAGYAALMVLVQVRLIPVYRTVPFGPGWWAFSFSYAAVFVDGIRWLAAEHVPHRLGWTYVLLAIISAAMAALAARTAYALGKRTFLPTPTAVR